MLLRPAGLQKDHGHFADLPPEVQKELALFTPLWVLTYMPRYPILGLCLPITPNSVPEN
jgi:hypothetical protein